LTRIPNETLLKLHQSPGLITSLLYPGLSVPSPAKPGFFSQLFGKKTPPPPVAPPAASLPPILEGDTMDLDKAWHGLHFLFTESDWEGDFPQGFIVSCGEPMGDEDVGYGPARSFTPDEVQKIATFLETQNEAGLRQRLDPKKMTELEIYPAIWDRLTDPNQADDEWEYLADAFRNLKKFIQETAAKRMALLIYLN